jgi:uncharacterized membrane protein
MLSRFLGYIPKEEENVQKRLISLCKRMYHFIELPSMIIAIASGLYLLTTATFGPKLGWFHSKMTFAVLLIASDLYLGKMIRGLSKSLALDGKTLKYKLLHAFSALMLIGVLSSIYLMRNKESEITDRVINNLKTNNQLNLKD